MRQRLMASILFGCGTCFLAIFYEVVAVIALGNPILPFDWSVANGFFAGFILGLFFSSFLTYPNIKDVRFYFGIGLLSILTIPVNAFMLVFSASIVELLKGHLPEPNVPLLGAAFEAMRNISIIQFTTIKGAIDSAYIFLLGFGVRYLVNRTQAKKLS